MNNMYDLTASKLEQNPTLLRIPLENIDRWIASGYSAPHRLEQWRQIILSAQKSTEGFQKMLLLLRSRDSDSERLREFAPFAGVLTAAERLTIIHQCAYSH